MLFANMSGEASSFDDSSVMEEPCGPERPATSYPGVVTEPVPFTSKLLESTPKVGTWMEGIDTADTLPGPCDLFPDGEDSDDGSASESDSEYMGSPAEQSRSQICSCSTASSRR